MPGKAPTRASLLKAPTIKDTMRHYAQHLNMKLGHQIEEERGGCENLCYANQTLVGAFSVIVKTSRRFVFSSTGGGVGTQVSPVREFLRPAAARLRGLEKGASTFKGNTAAGARWAASGTRILPSTVTRNTPRHDSVTTSQPQHITHHTTQHCHESRQPRIEVSL